MIFKFILVILISGCLKTTGPHTPEITALVEDLKCVGKAELMSERKRCLDTFTQNKTSFDAKVKKIIEEKNIKEAIAVKQDLEQNFCFVQFDYKDGIVQRFQEAAVDEVCVINFSNLKDFLLQN